MPPHSYNRANPPGRTPLLLVAEDHRVNRVLIERMLESLGYRIVLVENGRQAVEAVRAGNFDAVLLDLEMPVMGGLEAASTIRAMPGDAGKLPLLALTAHTPGEFEAEAKTAGFNGYVTKPIAAGELAAALNRLLQKN